jgi:hypothetical protein
VKNGVETATIYMSVSARPKKLALGAAASSLNFEGFAPGGQLGGATAKVKPTTCAVFKSKYPKAPIWQNYWSDQSYQGATDAVGLILEVLLGAHC